MQKAILPGVIAGLVIAASAATWAAEKKILKAAFAVPRNPNAVVIVVPQAPRPLPGMEEPPEKNSSDFKRSSK